MARCMPADVVDAAGAFKATLQVGTCKTLRSAGPMTLAANQDQDADPHRWQRLLGAAIPPFELMTV